jgi:hypothetical protein
MPHEIVAGGRREPRKPLLRRAMRGLLPPTILERRAWTNFNPFLVRALFECGPDPRHLLSEGLVRQSRLLDETGVTQLLGNPVLSVRRFAQWVALELWLRDLQSDGDEDGRAS